MIDIVEIKNGFDLQLADSVVSKAGNVVSVQLGDLEYAPSFGVDLKYFIESNFQIQNSSFKSYLIERLTQHQINVAQCASQVERLFEKLTFFVDDANKTQEGMIA